MVVVRIVPLPADIDGKDVVGPARCVDDGYGLEVVSVHPDMPGPHDVAACVFDADKCIATRIRNCADGETNILEVGAANDGKIGNEAANVTPEDGGALDGYARVAFDGRLGDGVAEVVHKVGLVRSPLICIGCWVGLTVLDGIAENARKRISSSRADHVAVGRLTGRLETAVDRVHGEVFVAHSDDSRAVKGRRFSCSLIVQDKSLPGQIFRGGARR